jgi:hypothetical protein
LCCAGRTSAKGLGDTAAYYPSGRGPSAAFVLVEMGKQELLERLRDRRSCLELRLPPRDHTTEPFGHGADGEVGVPVADRQEERQVRVPERPDLRRGSRTSGRSCGRERVGDWCVASDLREKDANTTPRREPYTCCTQGCTQDLFSAVSAPGGLRTTLQSRADDCETDRSRCTDPTSEDVSRKSMG